MLETQLADATVRIDTLETDNAQLQPTLAGVDPQRGRLNPDGHAVDVSSRR